MDYTSYAQALGAVILFVMQGLNQRKLKKIEANDLHELPLIVPELRTMNETLQRIEVKQSAEFSYIRAKLNGGN